MSAGTSRELRRRASHSWTAAAATNMTGAAMAANNSCARTSPRLHPNHRAPPLTRCAIRYAATKGNRRTTMSGLIQRQLSGIRVRPMRVGVLLATEAEVMRFDVFFDYTCQLD